VAVAEAVVLVGTVHKVQTLELVVQVVVVMAVAVQDLLILLLVQQILVVAVVVLKYGITEGVYSPELLVDQVL
jgi:hypothetical protein